MNETIDLIAALAVVALALGFLLWRRLRRRGTGPDSGASACGSCGRCGVAPRCSQRQGRVG
jgi:hypothetical protein